MQLKKLETSAVATDINRAFLGQIAEGPKAQANNFFIKWIEFTKGRHIDVNKTPDPNFSLKRTLSRNELADQVSLDWTPHINFVEPLTQWAEHIQ